MGIARIHARHFGQPVFYQNWVMTNVSIVIVFFMHK
jgi:hypothetical protein